MSGYNALLVFGKHWVRLWAIIKAILSEVLWLSSVPPGKQPFEGGASAPVVAGEDIQIFNAVS
jgi:hypothetical protein